MVYLFALFDRAIAGLRAMTAPATPGWAAHPGWLCLDDTWLAFLGYAWTPVTIEMTHYQKGGRRRFRAPTRA